MSQKDKPENKMSSSKARAQAKHTAQQATQPYVKTPLPSKPYPADTRSSDPLQDSNHALTIQRSGVAPIMPNPKDYEQTVLSVSAGDGGALDASADAELVIDLDEVVNRGEKAESTELGPEIIAAGISPIVKGALNARAQNHLNVPTSKHEPIEALANDQDQTVHRSEHFSKEQDPAAIAKQEHILAASKKEHVTIHVGHVIRERFVIKKILGSGGMGAVYQALDLRKQEAGDNDPYIAIKVLSGDFKYHDDAFVTMQREAKKTNALAHPNIVTVYDFDREDNLIYLTMEQLRGNPLDEIIRGKVKRNIDKRLALSIIEQIARGLSYAHSKGIVHSDLKPANIFLTDENVIKILDFGIARAINSEKSDDSFDAGSLGALTLAYASLEMIRFDPPHPSDDIYALGVIACELLIGEHPYHRKNAKIVNDEHLKPPKLNIRNPFLRRCIVNTIAVKREDRTADARQFLKSFDRSLKALHRSIVTICAIVSLLVINSLYIKTIDTQIVPFDTLTQVQQKNFLSLIDEGKTALRFNDLQGAVTHFDDAYSIHKTHKEMKRAQKQVVNILSERYARASEKDKPFIKQQAQALQNYPAFRSENIELNLEDL